MTGTDRRDVEFASSGAALRGWLFPGAGPGPTPGVVMAHGLSAVKEMFLDDYARAFAAAGLTALVYDHFGFGASDGEPRQWPDRGLQRQGYRDAIRWLARQPGVDPERIGLWGTSFSGGHVVTLAAEPLPVACAVVQVPYLVDEGSPMPAGALATVLRAVRAGGDVAATATVPAVTATEDGNGVMFEDGAFDWFTRAARRAPAWRNELLVRGLVGDAPDRPLDKVPAARIPLLVVVAPADRLTPPGPAMDVLGASPAVSVVEIGGGHFDAYEAGFEDSAGAAIDWFRAHLAP